MNGVPPSISINVCMLSHFSIWNNDMYCDVLKTWLLWDHLNTNVCSCSAPSSSSSTTTRVSFFFLKSSLVIFGQKKSPILVSPSKTKIPVGVSPRLKINYQSLVMGPKLCTASLIWLIYTPLNQVHAPTGCSRPRLIHGSYLHILSGLTLCRFGDKL